MTEDIKILDVKITTGFTMQEAVNATLNLLEDKCLNHHICTTNPEFIVDAQTDVDFRTIINSSDFSFPDGVGVALAKLYLDKIAVYPRNSVFVLRALYSGMTLISYLWQDKRSLKTIPGVSFVSELCKSASSKKLTVGFIGGWPRDRYGRPLQGEHNIAQTLAAKLTCQYTDLQVLLAESNILHKEDYDIDSRNKINAVLKDQKVDLLFVAFGHPYQEKWIKRNKEFINANVCIGVGGAFETLLATNSETIRGFTGSGYEWLYRLLTQPWRYKRICKAVVVFPIKVFINSLRHS